MARMKNTYWHSELIQLDLLMMFAFDCLWRWTQQKKKLRLNYEKEKETMYRVGKFVSLEPSEYLLRSRVIHIQHFNFVWLHWNIAASIAASVNHSIKWFYLWYHCIISIRLRFFFFLSQQNISFRITLPAMKRATISKMNESIWR